MRSDLMNLIGNNMEVEVQTVAEIPAEKSGKRPIIKIEDHKKAQESQES
jgi:hypothetical protein